MKVHKMKTLYTRPHHCTSNINRDINGANRKQPKFESPVRSIIKRSAARDSAVVWKERLYIKTNRGVFSWQQGQTEAELVTELDHG